jgi:hypothetical protein
MIQKHTDIYYTNKYGNRFVDEESARQDENLRDYCPYLIKTILPNLYLENLYGNGIEGINDYGKPYSGQINDKTKVYLFKDIIKNMQAAIDKYGDNVGFTYQHFGMGNYSNAIVLLENNLDKS